MSNQSSLYKYTKKNTYYMGHYSPIKIPFDSSDYIYEVPAKYNNKPGKLAYDLYGDERLMWVFRYFNNDIINDPIFDLKQGMQIRIPVAERLNKYI